MQLVKVGNKSTLNETFSCNFTILLSLKYGWSILPKVPTNI